MNALALEEAREVRDYDFDFIDESFQRWQDSFPITAQAGILEQYAMLGLNMRVRFGVELEGREQSRRDYLAVFVFFGQILGFDLRGHATRCNDQREWDIWQYNKKQTMFVDVVEFREDVQGVRCGIGCRSLVRLVRIDCDNDVRSEESEELKTIGCLLGRIRYPDGERGLPPWAIGRTCDYKLPSQMIERRTQVVNEVADGQRENHWNRRESGSGERLLPFRVIYDGTRCNLILRNGDPLPNQILKINEISLRTFDFRFDAI